MINISKEFEQKVAENSLQKQRNNSIDLQGATTRTQNKPIATEQSAEQSQAWC